MHKDASREFLQALADLTLREKDRLARRRKARTLAWWGLAGAVPVLLACLVLAGAGMCEPGVPQPGLFLTGAVLAAAVCGADLSTLLRPADD